jgi:hypothetical protein
LENNNDMSEEQFLLNPSCSELIGALKINSDQDFKLVLKELGQVLEVKTFLHVGRQEADQPTRLQVIKDPDEITRLIFESLSWNDIDKVGEVDCKIPVPASYLSLIEGKLAIDPQNADMIFDEIKLRVKKVDWSILFILEVDDFSISLPNEKQREETLLNFKKARLDLKPLHRPDSVSAPYKFSVELDEMKFEYKGESEHNPRDSSYLKNSLFAMICDLDVEYFPTLRKIIRLLSNRVVNHISSHDGGTTKHWEKWCAQNYAEYYIDCMGEPPMHENGTFYFLQVTGLSGFKAFLKEMNALGMKATVIDDKLTEVDPDHVDEFILIEGEPHLSHRGMMYPLGNIRLISVHLDLAEYEDIKTSYKLWGYGIEISVYPRGDHSVKGMDNLTFFIYLSDDDDHYWDDSADNLLDYLKGNAKTIRM